MMNASKWLFWPLVFIAGGLFIAHGKTEASPIVFAKGGSIIDEYVKYNDLTYLTLSIHVENAGGVSRVQGVLIHPYGEGEFETQIADSALVLSASISTFSDQIHFDAQLSEKLTNERTLLFSFRPIPGSDSTLNNRLTRNGAFQDSYPYSLAWVDLQATDRDGSVIEIQKYASPVVIWQDYGNQYVINTKALPKSISSVSFIKVNQDDFYPPWECRYLSEANYYYDDTSQIIDEHDSVVFLVKYADGSEEYFTVSDMQSTVALKPASGIYCFDDFD